METIKQPRAKEPSTPSALGQTVETTLKSGHSRPSKQNCQGCDPTDVVELTGQAAITIQFPIHKSAEVPAKVHQFSLLRSSWLFFTGHELLAEAEGQCAGKPYGFSDVDGFKSSHHCVCTGHLLEFTAVERCHGQRSIAQYEPYVFFRPSCFHN